MAIRPQQAIVPTQIKRTHFRGLLIGAMFYVTLLVVFALIIIGTIVAGTSNLG